LKKCFFFFFWGGGVKPDYNLDKLVPLRKFCKISWIFWEFLKGSSETLLMFWLPSLFLHRPPPPFFNHWVKVSRILFKEALKPLCCKTILIMWKFEFLVDFSLKKNKVKNKVRKTSKIFGIFVFGLFSVFIFFLFFFFMFIYFILFYFFKAALLLDVGAIQRQPKHLKIVLKCTLQGAWWDFRSVRKTFLT